MTDFNQAPYYDDFNKDGEGVNNFLRILFRYGYPIQARELTQIQSILQEQLKRFGSHIFKDGSKVSGGDLTINKVYYLTTVDIMSDPDSYTGKTITSASGITGVVLGLDRTSIDVANSSYILYFNYTSGGEFAAGDSLYIDGVETLTISSVTGALGEASLASINAGVFFIDGYFVRVEEQTIHLSNTWEPTITVGLTASDYIVTESEDSSLYDPAFGSTNYNAPGAHRYTITLTLSTRLFNSDNSTDSTFIEILKIEDGVVVTEISNPLYSLIEDELARRTFDESGNYTVDKFSISIQDHATDDESLNVVLGAGVAYVEGYRLETISNTTRTIARARDSEVSEGADSYISYGLYYNVSSITGGIFNFTTLEDINLVDASLNVLGTAKCKFIESNGDGTYRIFLTDINLVSSLSDTVRTIRSTSGSIVATIDLSDGTSDLLKGSNSVLITTINPQNPKVGSFYTVGYLTQYRYVGTLDSSFSMVIYTPSSSERFVGSGSYTGSDSIITYNYIFIKDGVITEPTSVSIPTVSSSDVGSLVVTFDSAGYVEILAACNVNASSAKSKIKTTGTYTGSIGTAWVDLPHHDIFTFEVIDASSSDVTSLYTLDNGHRDEYYDVGRIKKNSGSAEVVTINYEYFEHTGAGYFNVDSYIDVPYADIPYYTSGSNVYDLKSCFDFRPSVVGSSTSKIPRNNTSVSYDYEYYLSRIDLVIATRSKELKIVTGSPALNPKAPTLPEGSMILYALLINAYTPFTSSVEVEFYENKRYTMRDIGKLEKRIENLEYYTAISLLENKAITNSDSTKFKNGYLVDSFSDTNVIDFNDPETNVFIDTTNGICQPAYSTAVNYVSCSAVVIPSDIKKCVDSGWFIKSYTNKAIIAQSTITNFVNVNPFSIFFYNGNVILTPSVDEWIDTNYLPDVVTVYGSDVSSSEQVSQKVSAVLSVPWDDPNNITNTIRQTILEALNEKYGVNNVTLTIKYGVAGLAVGDNNFTVSETVTTTTKGTTSTLVTTDTSTTVVSQSVIPYIRSRDVSIVATNLIPTARHYLTFDGIDISQYVKPVGGSYGDAIITSSEGALDLIFTIPSGVFRTGSILLKLSDDIDMDETTQKSYGTATYTASGVLENVQTAVEQEWLTESGITASTSSSLWRGNWTDWMDPLAQTFKIDADLYPDGCYISAIDLFFVSKDDSIPVTVQIRPTVNGYPSSYEVYRFASKTLSPSSVVVNNKESLIGYVASSANTNRFQPTRFTFDTPIYLESGEHCFVVLSNSSAYEIGYATVGEAIHNDDTSIVSDNPYGGSMFRSQNSTTWTADQFSDIAFTIHRCSFSEGSSGDLIWQDVYSDNNFRYDAVIFESGEVSFNDAGISHQLSQWNTTTLVYEDTQIIPNATTNLTTPAYIVNDSDVRVKTTLTSTEVISPVISDCAIFLIQNQINNSVIDEELSQVGEAECKYIHKRVDLSDGFVANEMRIWFDYTSYSSNTIKVYVRTQNTLTDSSTFSDLGWVEVEQTDSDGIEQYYTHSDNDGFTSYQTKLVLLSSNEAQVPSISNFRVVSLQE